MIPFILIPLSIGLGLVGLGAFFWALEHDQFADPEGAASRILFADARSDHPSDNNGHHHGQLAVDSPHDNTDAGL